MTSPELTITPIRLAIRGMTCAHCAGRVEKALGGVPGTRQVKVDLALDEAQMLVEPGVTPDQLITAVRDAGYDAQTMESGAPFDGLAAAATAAARKEGLMVAGGALLLLPLVLPMLLGPWGAGLMLDPVTQFAPAAIIQAVLGWRFYRGAFMALRAGGANMDVLVALGSSAAFGQSAAALILWGNHGAMNHVYFEASAAIIVLVRFGKWLEARAKAQAGQSLRALERLTPPIAHRLSDMGIKDVPVASLVAGDLLEVRPGESFPADGLVREGETEADEALLTGESLPVAKTIGSPVMAGAVNGTGRVVMLVDRIGRQTMISRIAAAVAEARAAKAPIEAIVDRVSAVFVPVVMAVSAIVFLVCLWAGLGAEAALLRAVAVLVVACPCALGLATPIAVVAGTGVAARHGILVKDMTALERLAAVKTILFDKTGTITQGRPVVTGISPAAGGERETVLAQAAGALAASNHPVARAVVAAAAALGLAPAAAEDVKDLPGLGVTARVGGLVLLAGSARLMREKGITAPFPGGEGDLLLAYGGKPFGAISVRDQLRPETASVMAGLAADGLALGLLSGDAQPIVTGIGAEAGIADARGGLLPAQKAELVAARRADGAVVFVGDGINDAPALAAADAGIAMGSGTDAAIEAAGLALLRPDLSLLPVAITLARRTVATIRGNLFWAFAYNIIAIPVAALGYLRPELAGAAMALSSVSVAANALRLARTRLEDRS